MTLAESHTLTYSQNKQYKGHDMKEANTAIERVRDYLALRDSHARASAVDGNHIHGFGTRDGEAVLYADDLHALLGRSRLLQAERDAALLADQDAAEALAEVTEACLRMLDAALQGTGKSDMALKSDGSLTLVDGWRCLAAYNRARSNTTPDG